MSNWLWRNALLGLNKLLWDCGHCDFYRLTLGLIGEEIIAQENYKTIRFERIRSSGVVELVVNFYVCDELAYTVDAWKYVCARCRSIISLRDLIA